MFCRTVIVFILCCSRSFVNSTRNCTELESLLQSDLAREKLILDLLRIKWMMSKSQTTGTEEMESMDTNGVELLFNCLKESSGGGKNAYVKVPSELASIIHQAFIKPPVPMHDKYTTFRIKLTDTEGHPRLNLTCTSETSVIMPAKLELQCDFGA
ncbi:uncharacterized protein LOC119646326 [Hermetia illucens]|uniref:uncharacterized protein LOC119646326 n=1 Tax=Hermetia illucens TaxID=343691 RepID=UPI0018CC10BF|nr:uncharacterized protein LOC119646326 [Hermetia illucens]